MEKVTQINLKIVSKPRALLQTQEKTCAKFQNDMFKTVWEVAITRYLLSLHLRSENDKVKKKIEKKVIKIKARIIWKSTFTFSFQTMKKTCAKFQKDWYKIVWGVVSRGIHCLHIEGEKWLSPQCRKKKWKQNYLTIISKPHAHPHTIKKTYPNFHNNRYKTVRGVSLTRGTDGLYIKGEKYYVHNVEKWQKMI